jgi:glutamyl-Q tRNA(Asp) synthetase
VAALASWLDARAHGGRWLLRIEDVDTPRCVPGADTLILEQLARCGLQPDAPPLWQSTRAAAYQAALDRLIADGLAYLCACSRQDIAQAQAAAGIARQRGRELPYPGTCRPERGGLRGRAARAWRLHTGRFEQKWLAARTDPAQSAIDSEALALPIRWQDRRLGLQQQHLAAEVGDFILKRADGLWAYQLAVVVDDAAQGITDVVRGEDLADNTPRQIALQTALGLPTPRSAHPAGAGRRWRETEQAKRCAGAGCERPRAPCARRRGTCSWIRAPASPASAPCWRTGSPRGGLALLPEHVRPAGGLNWNAPAGSCGLSCIGPNLSTERWPKLSRISSAASCSPSKPTAPAAAVRPWSWARP